MSDNNCKIHPSAVSFSCSPPLFTSSCFFYLFYLCCVNRNLACLLFGKSGLHFGEI